MTIEELLQKEDALVSNVQNVVAKIIERNINKFLEGKTKEVIKSELKAELVQYFRESLKTGLDFINE